MELLQPVTGIKKTSHEETTPRDFRENLRNHCAPQARPRERAHTRSVNRSPAGSIFLFACGARTCHFAQVCGVLGGVGGGVCVFLSSQKWVADC